MSDRGGSDNSISGEGAGTFFSTGAMHGAYCIVHGLAVSISTPCLYDNVIGLGGNTGNGLAMHN